MPTTATLLQQAWQAMALQRLLDEAQVSKTIWRIRIDTDPATLIQLISRRKSERAATS